MIWKIEEKNRDAIEIRNWKLNYQPENFIFKSLGIVMLLCFKFLIIKEDIRIKINLN